ncbi:hypothetical protein PG985_003867 [Apiospora marii]|uniref:Uncharacterized protein n=1 Tax=Apiospora marii TaxID=335849 RepID=A0ABR1SHB4_9PEZI
MEHNNNQGSKRSRDDGSDSGKKNSHAKEPAPKRLKDESGLPAVASAPSRAGGNTPAGGSMKPPRATPERGAGSSARPSPSLAIRTIQGMNGGKQDSGKPSVPPVSSAPRIPGVSQYGPPSSSSVPAILRGSGNFRSQLPANKPRITRAPVVVPVAKKGGSTTSRSDRAESAARPTAASSSGSARPAEEASGSRSSRPRAASSGSDSSRPAVASDSPRSSDLWPALPNGSELDYDKRTRDLNEYHSKVYKMSPTTFMKAHGVEPSYAKPAPKKQERKPSTFTPGDRAASKDDGGTRGSNEPAAAQNTSTGTPLEQPVKGKDELYEDYCKRIREFHNQNNSNSSTDPSMPALRREGESLPDFRERQKAHGSAPAFEKKRPDEAIEDFQKRQDEHYKKHKLGKYKNAKEQEGEVDYDELPFEKAEKAKKAKKGKRPAPTLPSIRKPFAPSGTDKPSASSGKDSRDFDLERCIYINESRDPDSGIEFPPALFEEINDLDVPKKDEFNRGDVAQGYHSLPVYVVVLEQNRCMAHFNVLGTAQGMKTVNMLALRLFRQEVPKILPELRESVGLAHEEEKESLAQLQERLDRNWTKDVWTKSTGDIRETARLAWFVDREGDHKGLVTLSAALPNTKFQATVKVIKTKMVL